MFDVPWIRPSKYEQPMSSLDHPRAANPARSQVEAISSRLVELHRQYSKPEGRPSLDGTI